MTYLYKLESKDLRPIREFEYDINLKEFTPSIRNFLLPGEKKTLKTICVRILFQGLTLGSARLFYVQGENGDLIHTSYVIPACIKFPFMSKDDYEIGPCYTYPAYRGKGIYPRVLHAICSRLKNINSTFYMIVDESNEPSIKGIEKAGFAKYGVVQKSKFLKRYFKVM